MLYEATVLPKTSLTKTTLVRHGSLKVFPLAFPPPLVLSALSGFGILDISVTVDPLVPQEMGVPPEGFATHVAPIRLLPSVDFVMFEEAAALAESLPAANTLVGPLSSVSSLVLDEI